MRKTACRSFTPDSLGEDPTICIACLWSIRYHDDTFARGYKQGLIDLKRIFEDLIWKRLFDV